MDIELVIETLEKAYEPSESLDEMIASAIGWIDLDDNVEDGDSEWLIPPPTNLLRIPAFTSDLQEALNLLRESAPNLDVGFSWEPGSCSAAIKSHTLLVAEALTPAIAMCAVTLKFLLQKKHTSPYHSSYQLSHYASEHG